MAGAEAGNAIGPTRKIAEFVHATKFGDIPKAAVENAKLQILDTIGIGLAALEQPVARAIQRYVRAMGGEPVATVLGMEGYKTSPPQAALANGAFFNILDLDNHTATFVLPPLLAAGEMIGASGQQVVEAYVVAAEAATRIDHTIDAARPHRGGPTFRGWYHVSILGPIGAALAAGKLLGLSVDEIRGAMGTAASSSGGTRQNMGRKAKSLFAGNSSSAGVTAALLAREGMTGDPNILEAPLGLVHTLCSPNESDWSSIMAHLGQPFALEKMPGMTRYPAIGAGIRHLAGDGLRGAGGALGSFGPDRYRARVHRVSGRRARRRVELVLRAGGDAPGRQLHRRPPHPGEREQPAATRARRQGSDHSPQGLVRRAREHYG